MLVMVKHIKLGEEYGKMAEGGVMYVALDKMDFIYIYGLNLIGFLL